MREKVVSFVFIAVLVIFFALVMVFPRDEYSSVQENRPLAEMPEITGESVLSGEFAMAYEAYLTDNVGFRSKLVKLGTEIENARGIQRKDSGRIIDLPGGGRLVFTDGKIMEVYKENPAAAESYIKALNAYSDKFSEGHNMYVMLVPTQIEFDQSEYRALADSQKDSIDRIYSSLRKYKTVNVYDKLEKNKDQYIYFRTDHHWTQRGAYYGYESLMEAKGAKPASIGDMRVSRLRGFLGYLFNQANVQEYRKYADDIEYFEAGENYSVNAKALDENGNVAEYVTNIYSIPAAGTEPTYGVFMGGDHAFAEIDTNNKNGEVALIIKDSYANAVIPLLAGNYEKILVVDPRSFYGTVTQLTEEYEIDDIIFINYALTTSMPAFAEYIENIM